MKSARKIMSIRSLARASGFSIATVSRVLSGKKHVAENTRKKIHGLADRYGFRPNRVASSVFGRRTGSIGVGIPNLRVSYFADIAAGIQRQLLEVDCLPILLDFSQDDERKGIRRMIEHRVDGMILSIVDESLRLPELREILQSDLPLVMVDREMTAYATDSVCTDDVNGGRLAGEHLTALGHRRLGFCYYGEGASTCDTRLEGFRRTLAQAGLALRDEDIVRRPPRGADSEARFREDLRRLLLRTDRPTAIFAPTDLLAREVYRVARGVGLRIPADLSVVGYADLEFAAFLEPPLTTVRQNGLEVGRIAARLMLQRMEDRDRPAQRIVVPTALVARESAAALPNATPIALGS